LQKEITHFHLSGKCCVNLVSFQTCSFLGCLRSFSFSAILIFSYKAFLTCHQQCELVRKHQCWVVLSFSKKEAVATGMVPAIENNQFSTNQGTIFHPLTGGSLKSHRTGFGPLTGVPKSQRTRVKDSTLDHLFFLS
jgi:hypothetical protein